MKEILRKIMMTLMAIGFLAGLMIVLYPMLSNRWNEAREEELRTDYQNTVTEVMKDEQGEVEWQKAWDYNADLKPIIIPDSFIQAENEAYEDEAYMSCLNVAGDGVMGYISIPKIAVNIPIGHTTSDDVLKKGAGHLHGSSLPAGGEDSHAVLAAHRGLPGASLFTDIDQLEIGDQFYLYILDDVLAYEIDQILTVEPQETEALQVERGKDLVTLVTCTPYAVNSHRLLIRGHRVPYEAEIEQEQKASEVHSAHTNYALWIGVGLGSASLFLILYVLLRKQFRKKRHKKTAVSALIVILFFAFPFLLSNQTRVYAEALPDHSCSMNIVLQCEHQPVDGDQVTLYRIADIDINNGEFYIREDIFGDAVKSSDLADISIAKENEEVSGRILQILTEKEIAPDAQGVTSEEGILKFTALQPGLYLFCAEETEEVQTIPGLISVPQYQENTNGWEFDITVEPKTVWNRVIPGSRTTPVPTDAPEPAASQGPTASQDPSATSIPPSVPKKDMTGSGKDSASVKKTEAVKAGKAKTGDDTKIAGYLLLLLSGFAILLIMMKQVKIRNENNHESNHGNKKIPVNGGRK